MKILDLTKALKQYKSGWVAIDEDKIKVVAHAKSFDQLVSKIKDKENIFLMPASKDYFGFVT